MFNIISPTEIRVVAGAKLTVDVLSLSTVTTTGLGAALLGANSPAGVLSRPEGWLRIQCPDGDVGYIPVWR